MRQFLTGEVIRARITEMPLIFHYGLIVKYNNDTYIVHNPFMVGPSIDTLHDFFKNRYFEKSFGILTNKSDEQIIEKFNSIKEKKYSTFDFNCEDFINEMIGYFKFQRGKIELGLTIIIFLGLSTYAIFKLFESVKTKK